MRVIAGTARRIQLKTLEGLETRPTTDRIKETLFNMLSPSLYDCTFLDLFAGSGGIGIEALSRGAKEAVFVEKNPRAMACVRDNLKRTKLESKAVTISADVLSALRRLEGQKQFDYIFMDPPYQKGLEEKVLEYLSGSSLLADEGVVIVEAAMETAFDYVESLDFSVIKVKKYKTNKHVFIGKEEEEIA